MRLRARCIEQKSPGTILASPVLLANLLVVRARRTLTSTPARASSTWAKTPSAIQGSFRVISALAQVAPFVPFLVGLLVAVPALARVGGGEHYSSGHRDSSSSDDNSGILIDLVFLAIRYPALGIPLLLLFAGYVWYQRSQSGNGSTKKAFERMEEQARTAVSGADVSGWVAKLKEKDPAFDLLALFDKVKKLFTDVQQAWFRRELAQVRPFLSDASFQRLSTQAKLLQLQGVRDAIADLQLLDLQIIGLEQSQWFDTVHVRVKASLRDADVAATFTDAQAEAAAKKAPPEQFVEVWSFVRKPGALTKLGEDLYQGKCPNCGAPFNGGAANSCEACGAIVNSGNYDWVLAEITQGMEFVRNDSGVEGLAKIRQTDPALNTDVLEDRASLCFWRWIEAQSLANPALLAKLATPDFQARLAAEAQALKAQNRRKVFLECAVGAVQTRALQPGESVDLAHIEIRWSARQGIGPLNEKPPALPTLPQRWVFTLSRKAGVRSHAEAGMATSRCPQCNAPLSDSASTSCEFCGTALASGDRDWVLSEAVLWEAWRAHSPVAITRTALAGMGAQVVDRAERERLLYMMAALAMADGVIDPKERQLLRMCSDRWDVPWANVELAINAGPGLFDRLVAKQTPEAESFLKELVNLAMIDGKIDRKEKQMLEAAALHLGLSHRLPELLK
jgi:tellurite resistance protein